MADNTTKYQKLDDSVNELLSCLSKTNESNESKDLNINNPDAHILEKIADKLDICIDKVLGEGEESDKYKMSNHISVCCFNTDQKPEDQEILYAEQKQITIQLIETVLRKRKIDDN